MKTKYILGVKVDFGLSLNDVLALIGSYLKSPKIRYICTTNPEFIMAAQQDKEFKELINNSVLSLPDGSGLLFADSYTEKLVDIKPPFYRIKAFVTGFKLVVRYFFKQEDIGQKITGVSLFNSLCELAAKNNYSIFLLGGWPKDKLGHSLKGDHNIAQDTAKVMSDKYPALRIIGATSKFTPFEKDDALTVKYIKECMKKNGVNEIDIIFIAYGHNKQEKWFVRNGKLLPAKLGIGVGGTFDYITGNQHLPNEYIRQNNLEWLYRLFTQPWRFSRIIKAFPLFPFLVFINSIKHK